MVIKGFLTHMIDKIFDPPITFLDLAISKIHNIGLITAQGLDVSSYLAVFGDMPRPWQMCVTSLLGSVVLLSSIIIFRTCIRIYYAIKEAIPFI